MPGPEPARSDERVVFAHQRSGQRLGTSREMGNPDVRHRFGTAERQSDPVRDDRHLAPAQLGQQRWHLSSATVNVDRFGDDLAAAEAG